VAGTALKQEAKFVWVHSWLRCEFSSTEGFFGSAWSSCLEGESGVSEFLNLSFRQNSFLVLTPRALGVVLDQPGPTRHSVAFFRVLDFCISLLLFCIFCVIVDRIDDACYYGQQRRITPSFSIHGCNY
jgi:hypothetical protein